MFDYLIDKNDNVINVNESFTYTFGHNITRIGKLIKIDNNLLISWNDGKTTKYSDFIINDRPEWCKQIIEKLYQQ